jgi:hypothetical protein
MKLLSGFGAVILSFFIAYSVLVTIKLHSVDKMRAEARADAAFWKREAQDKVNWGKASDTLKPSKFLPEADTIVFAKPECRYFHFTYMAALKNSRAVTYGEDWVSCDYFPSSDQIDSCISTFLDYKRSCYQGITVLDIFEFKNKEDYDRFNNIKHHSKPVTKKLDCPGSEAPIEPFMITPSSPPLPAL